MYERRGERPSIVQPTPARPAAAKTAPHGASTLASHSLRTLTDGSDRPAPIQRVLVSFAASYSGKEKDTIEKGEANYRKADPSLYRAGSISDVGKGETLYLYAHGSPDSYAKMAPEALAKYLVANNLPVDCKHIHLLGCSTNMTNDSYAGKLKAALEDALVVGTSLRFVEKITGSPATAYTSAEGVQYTKDLVKKVKVPVPIPNNQNQILAEFDPLSSFQKNIK